ncbi:MAG: type II toxin-antitoxin system mRNA interferase toxin, RelE/StbE family [Candidatus Saccharimonas sp.]|nr:type II toxin-antitoxin system mRNA interferase toxin, RelE/StbE family [Planctomycetaceae bacterium]
MNRVLLRSSAFVRAATRLLKRSPDVADDLQATLQQLADDAFHPQLKTHKLKGDLAGSWSCSVEYDLRIVFEFVQHDGAEAILLQSIGTHDEVY